MQDSLAKRAISSTLWQGTSSFISTGILFARSIFLARWVPVESFGIYGYAGAIIAFSSILADFGISAAFIHRTEETQDESQAAANVFALKGVLIAIWAGLVALGAFTVIDGQYRGTVLILTSIQASIALTSVPRLILLRRVVHRRLSLLSMASDIIGTAVALFLAWRGYPLAALISTNLVASLVSIIGLYGWRPVWRPKVDWSPAVVRYLLRFGVRSLVPGLLARGIDQVDDIWTGNRLGSEAVGYYSKAYAFATYPRKVVAAPLIQVATGSYATLKGKRRQLSEAFFRVNAALVRSSFLFGGLLALIAPEFIRILLGDQWMPMLDAYRLMLIFTLLDPIKVTIANLFVAIGKPEHVTVTRLVQLFVLVLGLVTLGARYGIAGVALAVDAMLLIGIVMFLVRAKSYVDFTAKRLFGAPALALIGGMAVARGTLLIPGVLGSDWRTAAAKISGFVVVYAIVLLSLERKETEKMLRWTLGSLRRKDRPQPLG